MQNLDLDLVDLLQLVTPRSYSSNTFYDVPRSENQLWDPQRNQLGYINFLTKHDPRDKSNSLPLLDPPVSPSAFARALCNYYLDYHFPNRVDPPPIDRHIRVYARAHVKGIIWPTQLYQDLIRSYARGNCFVWFTRKENK